MHDPVRHHAVVQPPYRIASSRQAKPWEETMHEAGERANQHAAAKAEGHAHVLEVGLVDGSRVVGEAADHRVILAIGPGNGLLPLRNSAQN